MAIHDPKTSQGYQLDTVPRLHRSGSIYNASILWSFQVQEEAARGAQGALTYSQVSGKVAPPNPQQVMPPPTRSIPQVPGPPLMPMTEWQQRSV